MIQKNYKIVTNEGLHARPSSQLVAAVTPADGTDEAALMAKVDEVIKAEGIGQYPNYEQSTPSY